MLFLGIGRVRVCCFLILVEYLVVVIDRFFGGRSWFVLGCYVLYLGVFIRLFVWSSDKVFSWGFC